jgi:hypothetical protein
MWSHLYGVFTKFSEEILWKVRGGGVVIDDQRKYLQ